MRMREAGGEAMLHEMAEGVDPVAGAGNERVAADPAAPNALNFSL